MHRSILIVDDEVPITDFITEALQEEGYAVQAVHGATDALAQLARSQVGLLLLDAYMPLISGEQLLAQLRDDPRYAQLPVIMMSASTSPAELLNRYPAVSFLLKPFDIETLLQMVATALDYSDQQV